MLSLDIDCACPSTVDTALHRRLDARGLDDANKLVRVRKRMPGPKPILPPGMGVVSEHQRISQLGQAGWRDPVSDPWGNRYEYMRTAKEDLFLRGRTSEDTTTSEPLAEDGKGERFARPRQSNNPNRLPALA